MKIDSTFLASLQKLLPIDYSLLKDSNGNIFLDHLCSSCTANSEWKCDNTSCSLIIKDTVKKNQINTCPFNSSFNSITKSCSCNYGYKTNKNNDGCDACYTDSDCVLYTYKGPLGVSATMSLIGLRINMNNLAPSIQLNNDNTMDISIVNFLASFVLVSSVQTTPPNCYITFGVDIKAGLTTNVTTQNSNSFLIISPTIISINLNNIKFVNCGTIFSLADDVLSMFKTQIAAKLQESLIPMIKPALTQQINIPYNLLKKFTTTISSNVINITA